MIRVLVADDSRSVRAMLREVLESDSEIRVAAEAENGAEAVQQCLEVGPDVVLMDVNMPVMDGLEAVERIMRERPTPVIILSATVSPGEVKSAFRAVRAGAFEAIPKPEGVTSVAGYARLAGDLLSRIRLYARVGRRRGWREGYARSSARSRPAFPAVSPKVVAIGASTGGPQTTQAILAALPATFPCPILLVQHISPGFTRGFAQWLQRETPFQVHVLERAERLQGGTVYLAEDGKHLVAGRGVAMLRDDPPVNACRPSVDVLFQSLTREYGKLGIAVLLTGIGRDGALGALALRKTGGEVIVQDESSSVIFGMPKAAVDIGAATRIVPAGEIPRVLAEVIGRDGVARTEKEPV